MTTFPPLPAQSGSASTRRGLRSEGYPFQVGGKHYTLQFLPMTYLEGYSERQLAALEASAAYEVSFRLENYTLPDGAVLGGYGAMGTGDAFRVLGGIANGIMDWSQRRQPDYLYWYAQGTRQQRLYERMVQYFATRGSGMGRLRNDPFTGLSCEPEVFWLPRSALFPVVFK